MKFLNLDKLKRIFFVITPNLPDSSTKTYKFSIFRSILYISIYTLISWMILIFILSITPLKDFLFVLDNQELIAQRKKINELQEKVKLLTGELESISSTNEKIKYSLRLATRDSSDTSKAIYDTLKKKITKKINLGGNILLAFKELFSKLKNENYELVDSIVFIAPAIGILTKGFDPKIGHLGVDYGLKIGTPIYASAGGLVIFADYTIDYGYTIIIQHDSDYITMYKHCSILLKRPQDFVRQGELIALSGNSGRKSTGPHLHFELWHKGKPLNPERIIIK
ncbi:M23 family metallopeptidase [Rosettibacter firmus]|uniref:M23 family metallopeptidase n=1 Tax=Rosettibacter firmus TaxID=3111522 RepID=UPI00336C1DAD